MVKNPIGLARLILEESNRPLSLQRVPPNLLVGQGAFEFAQEKGVLTVYNDFLVSRSAKERWNKWKQDLEQVEQKQKQDDERHLMRKSSFFSDNTLTNRSSMSTPSELSPPVSPPSGRSASTFSRVPTPNRPLMASTADIPNSYFEARTKKHSRQLEVERLSLSDHTLNTDMDRNPNIDGNRPPADSEMATDDNLPWSIKRRRLSANKDGCFDDPRSALGSTLAPSSPTLDKPSAGTQSPKLESDDRIIDTVGAIAVDCFGNIAAGSSSGGIGMKHRGRCGPAALVGIGSAVVPVDPDDPDETCVATVTSGTGEHMATTLAAATCADRIYSSVRKTRGGVLEDCTEDEAMFSVIDREFMGHPGVRNSHCAGAIGIMAVKKTRQGIMLFFGHNTDSFALASMQTGDRKALCVMSRNKGTGSIAQGGRVAKYRGSGNGLRP